MSGMVLDEGCILDGQSGCLGGLLVLCTATPWIQAPSYGYGCANRCGEHNKGCFSWTQIVFQTKTALVIWAL